MQRLCPLSTQMHELCSWCAQRCVARARSQHRYPNCVCSQHRYVICVLVLDTDVLTVCYANTEAIGVSEKNAYAGHVFESRTQKHELCPCQTQIR